MTLGWLCFWLCLVVALAFAGFRLSRGFIHQGGVFVRLWGRWRGLFLFPPFLRLPVIAGGSDGLVAQGTYLLISDGASPLGYDEIPEVVSIDGPTDSDEKIDFTHLRSVGRRRESKPGFIDPGTLQIEIQYIPSNAIHQRILSYKDAGTLFTLHLVFSDGTGWDLTDCSVGATPLTGLNVGGKLGMNITFNLSGATDYSGTGSPA